MNCWEIMKCGREAGGTKVRRFGICPSYPNHGKDCAEIAGDRCAAGKQSSFISKFTACLTCDFNNYLHCIKSEEVLKIRKIA